MKRHLIAAALLCAMCAHAVVAGDLPQPVAAVCGYHGGDGPIILKELTRRGIAGERMSGWLPIDQYGKYSMVIQDGSLQQARVTPDAYSPEDLPKLQAWLEAGGILWIANRGNGVLDTPHGKRWRDKLVGAMLPGKHGPATVLRADHPWTAHLKKGDQPTWAKGFLWQAKNGENVIGAQSGYTSVYRLRVGKGQIVGHAWQIFRHKPPGRTRATPAQEKNWQEQILLVRNMVTDLYPQAERPTLPTMYFNNPYALPEALAREMPTKPDAEKFRSHRPIRPLPTGNNRPLADGPKLFVDGKTGDNANAGTEAKPFKTIQHGVDQLKPGDTLVIRSGLYYEQVTVSKTGTPEKPITLRAYPRELVTIDAGIPEFYSSPNTSWEPCPDGVAGEFQSVKKYPGLGTTSNAVNVFARFGDSLVPLQGYRWRKDLQNPSMLSKMEGKSTEGDGMYCGPGVWYNVSTQRIHCRLAHTDLKALGVDNYRGVTDPRHVWLVLAGGNAVPLKLNQAWHVRLQDLVLRGSRSSALSITRAGDVVLDGLSIYGGVGVCGVSYTQGLRAVNSSFHGPSAPWTFRGSLKYRSVEAKVFSAAGWQPIGNSDFELAYCEFTDSVDGVFIGGVDKVRFHHNIVHSFSDDALFVTATADDVGNMPGGPIHITENYFGRTLTAFAYGVGHGRQLVRPDGSVQTGDGLWVCRNVFDFRQPVRYGMPAPDAVELPSYGRSGGDHGSPVWEPMWYYHNTVIAMTPAWRSYYGNGWGGHMQVHTRRRLLNNIFLQATGGVDSLFSPLTEAIDIFADGNLHWVVDQGDKLTDVVEKLRGRLSTEWTRYLVNTWRKTHINPPKKDPGPPALPGARKKDAVGELFAEADKKAPPAEPPVPEWMAHDVYGDPMFMRFTTDYHQPLDVRVAGQGAGVDKGVDIPADWPDPMRKLDKGRPDIGALPLGADDVRVGCYGRFSISGPPIWHRDTAVMNAE